MEYLWYVGSSGLRCKEVKDRICQIFGFCELRREEKKKEMEVLDFWAQVSQRVKNK